MKSFCVSRTSISFVFSLLLVTACRVSVIAAQSEPAATQESVQSLQVTANDEIAAQDIAGHRVHLHPLRSRAESRSRYEDPEVRRGNPQQGSSEDEEASSRFATPTVPTVAAPGFYPADLSDPKHGKVLTVVQSNNVYVNCAPSCWGSPSTFLARLAVSNLIHVTDQYVGATGNNRYTVGAATSINAALPAKLTSNNILQLVHTAARAHGSGYDHIYHVFLRAGVDVCTSANVCYSPDNLATSSSAHITEALISRISATCSIPSSPIKTSRAARWPSQVRTGRSWIPPAARFRTNLSRPLPIRMGMHGSRRTH